MFEIKNQEKIHRILDYSGTEYNRCGFTDIDGFREYHDKGFIFLEAKEFGKSLPDGQNLAFERLINAISKPAILFIAEHLPGLEGDILLENTICRKFFYKGKWHEIPAKKTTIVIQKFIDEVLDKGI